MSLARQNNNLSFFSFGNFSSKLYYPFGMVLSHLMIYIAYDIFSMENNIKNEDKIDNKPYFLTFVMFSIEFLVIIVYFIHLLLTKGKKDINLKVNRMNISQSKQILNSFKIILLLFVCFLCDFISTIPVIIIRNEEKNDFLEVILKVLTIPFISLLSALILHYKYYKHHIIGYIITSIGLILHPMYLWIFEKNKDIELTILIQIIGYLLSSFIDVIEKYLTDIKFISPYLIISAEGFFGFCLSFPLFKLCLLIIEKTDFISLNNYFDSIQNSLKYQIGIVVYCIGVFLYNIMRILTTQKCSPVHRVITNTFSAFLGWIIHYFFEDKDSPAHIIIEAVGYMIVFFGLMIFLELLIINKWGMNQNTTFNIDQRGIEENVEIKAGMLYSSIGYSEDSNTLSEGFHSKHYKNNDELIF